MFVVTYDDHDDCSGISPPQLVDEAFYNDQTFDSQRGFGFSVGAQYGPAVTQREKQQYDWKACYSWNEAEQESHHHRRRHLRRDAMAFSR